MSINNVARSITGSKRTDHIKIDTLLTRAHLPSYNELVVRAVAMESWKAFHSSDGCNGERNPAGKVTFPIVDDGARPTRSRTAGLVSEPFRGHNTFAAHAAKVWNASLELRMALTKQSAKVAAVSLAKKAPT